MENVEIDVEMANEVSEDRKSKAELGNILPKFANRMKSTEQPLKALDSTYKKKNSRKQQRQTPEAAPRGSVLQPSDDARVEALRMKDIQNDPNSAADIALSTAARSSLSPERKSSVRGARADSSRDSSNSVAGALGGVVNASDKTGGGKRRASSFANSEPVPRKVEGREIQQGHAQYLLTYGMMLGIRVMTGRQEADALEQQSRNSSKLLRKSSHSFASSPSALINGSVASYRQLTEHDYKHNWELRFPPEGVRGPPITLPPHKLPFAFKFKDYMGSVFRAVRSLSGIDEADYMLSIAGDFNYIEFIANSKSGQFFFYTHDQKYMIKTQSRAECILLRKIMKKYVNHLIDTPDSLLVRFFGMYRVKMKTLKKTTYFVVMSSVFCTPRTIHVKYDLKGSYIGRITKEDDCRAGAVQKDINFHQSNRKICLGQKQSSILERTLRKDAYFLRDLNIMDYSLLLGIYDGTQVVAAGANGEGRASTARRGSIGMIPAKSMRGNDIALAAVGKATQDFYEDGVGNRKTAAVLGEGSVFQSYDGGMKSSDEVDEVYFMGIIDILQLYNAGKKFETAFKSIRHDTKKLSSVNPELYAQRMINFVMDHTDYSDYTGYEEEEEVASPSPPFPSSSSSSHPSPSHAASRRAPKLNIRVDEPSDDDDDDGADDGAEDVDDDDDDEDDDNDDENSGDDDDNSDAADDDDDDDDEDDDDRYQEEEEDELGGSNDKVRQQHLAPPAAAATTTTTTYSTSTSFYGRLKRRLSAMSVEGGPAAVPKKMNDEDENDSDDDDDDRDNSYDNEDDNEEAEENDDDDDEDDEEDESDDNGRPATADTKSAKRTAPAPARGTPSTATAATTTGEILPNHNDTLKRERVAAAAAAAQEENRPISPNDVGNVAGSTTSRLGGNKDQPAATSRRPFSTFSSSSSGTAAGLPLPPPPPPATAPSTDHTVPPTAPSYESMNPYPDGLPPPRWQQQQQQHQQSLQNHRREQSQLSHQGQYLDGAPHHMQQQQQQQQGYVTSSSPPTPLHQQYQPHQSQYQQELRSNTASTPFPPSPSKYFQPISSSSSSNGSGPSWGGGGSYYSGGAYGQGDLQDLRAEGGKVIGVTDVISPEQAAAKAAQATQAQPPPTVNRRRRNIGSSSGGGGRGTVVGQNQTQPLSQHILTQQQLQQQPQQSRVDEARRRGGRDRGGENQSPHNKLDFHSYPNNPSGINSAHVQELQQRPADRETLLPSSSPTPRQHMHGHGITNSHSHSHSHSLGTNPQQLASKPHGPYYPANRKGAAGMSVPLAPLISRSQQAIIDDENARKQKELQKQWKEQQNKEAWKKGGYINLSHNGNNNKIGEGGGDKDGKVAAATAAAAAANGRSGSTGRASSRGRENSGGPAAVRTKDRDPHALLRDTPSKLHSRQKHRISRAAFDML